MRYTPILFASSHNKHRVSLTRGSRLASGAVTRVVYRVYGAVRSRKRYHIDWPNFVLDASQYPPPGNRRRPPRLIAGREQATLCSRERRRPAAQDDALGRQSALAHHQRSRGDTGKPCVRQPRCQRCFCRWSPHRRRQPANGAPAAVVRRDVVGGREWCWSPHAHQGARPLVGPRDLCQRG